MADRMQLNHNTTVELIDRCEKRGLLRRVKGAPTVVWLRWRLLPMGNRCCGSRPAPPAWNCRRSGPFWLSRSGSCCRIQNIGRIGYSFFRQTLTMTPESPQDPRIRAVQWRDLTRLSRSEVLLELILPLPWLAASWCLAGTNLFLLALPASFMFFLTGLRLTHNAYHYALGFRAGMRRGDVFAQRPDAGLHARGADQPPSPSPALSGRARCRRRERPNARMEGDCRGTAVPGTASSSCVEDSARRVFSLDRSGNRGNRRSDRSGLAFTVGLAALSHGAMIAGQCLTSFFAVWTVHHDCDESTPLARTLRAS